MVEGGFITYDSGMIIRETEGAPLTIWNNGEQNSGSCAYYQDDIRFDIVDIGRYDIILGVP